MIRELRVYSVNADGLHGEDIEYLARSYSAAEKIYNAITDTDAAYKSITYDDDKLGTVIVKREVLRGDFR